MAAFIAEKVCALPFELEESFNAFLRAFILNGLDILYKGSRMFILLQELLVRICPLRIIPCLQHFYSQLMDYPILWRK